MRWIIKFIVSVLCRFQSPKGPLPFDCHLAVWFLPPGATLCRDSTALPILVLRFCKWNDKRRASPHPPAARSPSLGLNTGRIDEGSYRTHFFSSAPSLMTSSGEASLNCGVLALNDLVPRRRPPTSTAWCFDEVPRPLHDAFTTFLPQTCDNTFSRAITISLLVRQKLKLSHSPCGAACALKTFASFALALSCITTTWLNWKPCSLH